MIKSKKNICFINTTKAWGGGEKWHFEIASFLYDKKYHVSFITRQNSALSRKLSNTSINKKDFRVSNISFLNPLKILHFILFFKRNKIATVVLNLPTDLKLAGIAAKLAGVKKIIYRRGSAIPIKNRLLNRFLLKNVATHILANSQKTKETIISIKENLLDPNKITVIYNGIDLNKFNNIDPSKRNFHDIIIGNLGRMVHQKGQEYLIRLGEILELKKIPFKIIIAGDGSLKTKLENKVKELKLEDKILFPGFCEDINSFMQSIDLFILSSRWEGFGYVIAEAMASQKPVIAFDISSNPELIENGTTGFLVPPFDIELMADKIIELYSDRNKLQSFGINGRKKIEDQFDSKKIFEKIEKYLTL